MLSPQRTLSAPRHCQPAASSSRPSRLRTSSSTVRVACALSQQHNTSTATPAAMKPPRSNAKVRLDRMFADTHEEMVARNLRVMHIKTLLSESYYFRHPEDAAQILANDDKLYGKTARVAQSKEWLGQGVFSTVPPEQHAAARATLNPAFRRDYLARLDTFMVDSALQLRQLLAEAAAAAGPGGGGGAAPSAAAAAGGVSAGIDMQRLFRLLTLDTIGLTSLNKSFDAMKQWQAQQQQPGALNISSSSGGGGGQLELEQLLCDLEAAFLWQSLMLPVPRSWLPGWSKYIKACRQLDALINNMLQDVRTQEQQPQAGGSNHTSSSSSRQTLVSFLLAAQQQQGREQISDQHIQDEIKTIMFGGTDTSAFTLAMSAHYLASNPAAAARAEGEVQELLSSTGRSRDVSQLRAEDAAKLPWVTACVNETMRLGPAGPVITRTALKDTEVAGYHIPRGLSVGVNIYAMHRHPDVWPQPNDWLPQRWIPAEAAAAGLTTRNIGNSDSSSGSSNSSKAQQPFLPFSTGPRGCIGRNYAMLQMVLTLAVLLGSGVRFGRVPGAPPVEFVKSMTMHSEKGVWLVPHIV